MRVAIGFKRWQRSICVLVLAAVPFLASAQGSDAADERQAEVKLELQDLVTSWASAWQSQLEEIYFMHYHPEFRPEGFGSLDAWRSSRRARLKDPENINISLRGFELVSLSQDTAIVRFWLDYSRPGYADHTHKELRLRLSGHIWMIEHEHNLEVSKAAP